MVEGETTSSSNRYHLAPEVKKEMKKAEKNKDQSPEATEADEPKKHKSPAGKAKAVESNKAKKTAVKKKSTSRKESNVEKAQSKVGVNKPKVKKSPATKASRAKKSTGKKPQFKTARMQIR